ncbi:hypothetical protein BDZ45DRAFT_486410 [Acephala macrosclerotiorum]|nr:hypothetical protein BDZ45DRAFT_486410 [Acephala macrosclerotiorum]
MSTRSTYNEPPVYGASSYQRHTFASLQHTVHATGNFECGVCGRLASTHRGSTGHPPRLGRSSTAIPATSIQRNPSSRVETLSSSSSSLVQHTGNVDDGPLAYAQEQQAEQQIEQQTEQQVYPADPIQGAAVESDQPGSRPVSLPQSHTSEAREDTAGSSQQDGGGNQGVKTRRRGIRERPPTPPPSDSTSSESTGSETDSDQSQKKHQKKKQLSVGRLNSGELGLIKSKDPRPEDRYLPNGMEYPVTASRILIRQAWRR